MVFNTFGHIHRKKVKLTIEHLQFIAKRFVMIKAPLNEITLQLVDFF